MNAIFKRTSVRKYEDRTVEKEKIEKILQAAFQAPTAGNQQSWQFYVVENKEVLAQLAACSPYAGCVKDAPVAIVVAYDEDGIFPDYNHIDCAIACENIMLEAVELGLGSVMLGIAPLSERMKAVEKVLDMPINVHAFSILPIGYPVSDTTVQNRYNNQKIHWK